MADRCVAVLIRAMRDAALEQAYRNTTYVVDHPEGAIGIRIGASCPQLDAWLAQRGATRWVFVTAWNPCSEGHTENINKINMLHNDALRAELTQAGHVVITGRGVPDGNDWTPEESFLIPGMHVAAALALGRRYRQHAIVAGVAGGCAVLHWCVGDDADKMPAS